MTPWKIAAPDARAEISIVAMGAVAATEHTGSGINTGPLLTPAGEAAPSGN